MIFGKAFPLEQFYVGSNMISWAVLVSLTSCVLAIRKKKKLLLTNWKWKNSSLCTFSEQYVPPSYSWITWKNSIILREERKWRQGNKKDNAKYPSTVSFQHKNTVTHSSHLSWYSNHKGSWRFPTFRSHCHPNVLRFLVHLLLGYRASCMTALHDNAAIHSIFTSLPPSAATFSSLFIYLFIFPIFLW